MDAGRNRFIRSRETDPLAALLDCIHFHGLLIELVKIPVSVPHPDNDWYLLRDRTPQIFDYISPVISGSHDFTVYELICKAWCQGEVVFFICILSGLWLRSREVMGFCTKGGFQRRERTESKSSELTRLTEKFYTFKIWCLPIMALLTIPLEARIWTQKNWTNILIESTSPCIVAVLK